MSTADFFTPIVDDAATWGRIAAVNAASDVFAMGGRPLFALALAAWPRDVLPLDLLAEVLEGGRAAAADGGWVVAGGHTVDAPEPMYGQSVTGELAPDHEPLTNAGARPGHRLVLTKPIGTGVVATMVKRSEVSAVSAGGVHAESYAAAVHEMTRHNDVAATRAREAGAVAATDVTGFGLLGHLGRMALASGVDVEVDVGSVPVLDGVPRLVAEGFVPGGTRRNLAYVRPSLEPHDHDERTELLLADAQTSGGLLLVVPEDAAVRCVEALVGDGHRAAIVGAVTGAGTGRIQLR